MGLAAIARSWLEPALPVAGSSRPAESASASARGAIWTAPLPVALAEGSKRVSSFTLEGSLRSLRECVAATAADSASAVHDQQPRFDIQATESAFAAIKADGTVITWGHPFYGGDSDAVRDQLVDVQHIQATDFAFAAIKDDGTVITWGDPGCGLQCQLFCQR